MTRTQCPNCDNDLPVSALAYVYCPLCRFPLVLIANKYRMEKALSEGGFGAVFLAHHIHLRSDSARAIKVIKPALLQDERIQKRFFDEVQMTAALSQRNEHIVRIYDDFGEEQVLGFYYVMEFLQGTPLKERMTWGLGRGAR